MRSIAVVGAILASICTARITTVAGGMGAAFDPAAPFLANNFTGVTHVRKGSPDNVLYAQGFGTLDFRGNIPMPTDARFPVASNTKVYVAISLYQLQERGVVDLTKNVQDYLGPEDFQAFGVPQATRYCPTVQGDTSGRCYNFTWVQMLNMQTCIQDEDYQYLSYPGSLGLVFGRYFNNPLACVPGTKYYYSNPAFMLGAYMVEKFTGMTWRAYLEQNVLGPLGMKDTYFDPFDGQFQTDLMRVEESYQTFELGSKAALGRGRCSREFDLGSASGAGGIVSTQRDEALLYFTLFNFSKAATGAPLFKNRQSLIDLVRPRTVVGSFAFNNSLTQYYAQGLFVTAASLEQEVPMQVTYEGEIMCSHTSNRFIPAQFDSADGTTETVPAFMAQAWTGTRVAYTTPSDFTAAQESGSRSMQSSFASWTKREWLGALSWSLVTGYSGWPFAPSNGTSVVA